MFDPRSWHIFFKPCGAALLPWYFTEVFYNTVLLILIRGKIFDTFNKTTLGLGRRSRQNGPRRKIEAHLLARLRIRGTRISGTYPTKFDLDFRRGIARFQAKLNYLLKI